MPDKASIFRMYVEGSYFRERTRGWGRGRHYSRWCDEAFIVECKSRQRTQLVIFSSLFLLACYSRGSFYSHPSIFSYFLYHMQFSAMMSSVSFSPKHMISIFKSTFRTVQNEVPSVSSKSCFWPNGFQCVLRLFSPYGSRVWLRVWSH